MTVTVHPLAKSLLAVLGLLAARQLFVARRRALRDPHPRKPDPVKTWENEGGAVPVSSHRTAAAVNPLPGGEQGAG
jgi:hypothetical protein